MARYLHPSVHRRRHRYRSNRRHKGRKFLTWKQLMLIKLETLDGSYEKWPALESCFKYEFDLNKNLEDFWKHRLLLQQLTGPERDSIALFAADPNSYKRTVAQLKRLFDNPTAARNAIVKKFCAFPPLKISSVEGFRALLAAFDAATGTLKTLRLPGVWEVLNSKRNGVFRNRIAINANCV